MDVELPPIRPIEKGPKPGEASAVLSWKPIGLYVTVLAVLFAWPLWDWVRFSLDSDLFSHTLLMPFVTVYLSRLVLKQSNPRSSRSRVPALSFGIAGFGTATVCGLSRWSGWSPPVQDYLTVVMFSFLLLAAAGGFYFLGANVMRTIAFPVMLLIFIVPFPTILVHAIEVFFQHTSAAVSYALLKIIGTPVFRDGLIFQLPGIAIEVAEECSGIRSSLVLFITSLIAGHLFLTRWGSKMFLAVVVIPLAIIRNAIRIVTIALLCVHVSPEMINSMIHRRGGPLFFALSLVPFFLFLLWLRKLDARKKGLKSEIGTGCEI